MHTTRRRSIVSLLGLLVMLSVVLVPSAPAAASHEGVFRDTVNHLFEYDIAALGRAGITAGCGDGNYCPDRAVTRGQMAAFLHRALDLPPGSAQFDDTRGHVFEADIAALARAGITKGYDDGRFGPGDTLTRGQMAAFLRRALDLPRGSAQFDDTRGHVFEADIAALARAGITTGYGNGDFGPNDTLTRGQMAAFLVRAELAPALPASERALDPASPSFLDEVGPRTGQTATWTERRTLREAGRVFAGVRTLDGASILVKAPGAGVRDCDLDSGLRVDAKVQDAWAVVSHCEAEHLGGAVLATNNLITGNGDGINPRDAGPSLIQRNRIIRDGSRVGDYHHDGIQVMYGSNIMVRENHITGWSTSAVLIKPDLGPIRNVLLQRNRLGNPTGYYSVYVRRAGSRMPEMVTIRDNVFERGASAISVEPDTVFVRTTKERQDAIDAGVRGARTWIVWDNNRWLDSGKVISPPNGWRR